MSNILKEAFLQKGWAGKTISRAETVDLLNPHIERHVRLNNDYGYVIKSHPSADVRSRLDATQKVARANIGKLSETVYSCGGVAYTGVDLEPSDVDLGSDPQAMLQALLRSEDDVIAALEAEDKIEHQMRTRAIIGVALNAARERKSLLEELLRQGR